MKIRLELKSGTVTALYDPATGLVQTCYQPRSDDPAFPVTSRTSTCSPDAFLAFCEAGREALLAIIATEEAAA